MNSLRKLFRLAGGCARVAVCNPRRLPHILGSALAAAEEVTARDLDLVAFPRVTVEDLLPPAGTDLRASLALIPKTNASVSVLEFLALILLLKRTGAKHAFEFGTYKGVSTSQLALNLAEGGRLHTLDLPEGDPRSAFAITDPEDIVIAHEKGKGALVPADLRDHVTFLRQDSATFDEQPFAGRMDFVFVDGAHNADYVRNDSEKAWTMLRPGGIAAWHDCRVADPAVVRYLLRSPYRPSLIAGTSLAFATKP